MHGHMILGPGAQLGAAVIAGTSKRTGDFTGSHSLIIATIIRVTSVIATVTYVHIEYVCMYACADVWMYGCMDAWIYVRMYVCM